MKWTQLKVSCLSSDLEQVCAVMSMLDSGLMIEDYRDIGTGINAVYGELIDEELLKIDPMKSAVSIYLSEDKNYNEYIAFLRERFAALGIEYKTELLGVDEEDWANSWKRYYKPVKIGDRLVVVPEWEEYTPADGEVIVKMDPGMAFGTGTHESTRLCARLLEEHIKPGMNVLDVGTGSGILAIFADKLGASRVFACDIDPMAVRIAGENAARNGASNVTCAQSDLLTSVSLENGLYDLACANIVAEIIVRMAADIGAYMKYGGIVLASGIIDSHADEVIAAMEAAGFDIADAISENDWRALAFIRTLK